MTANERPKHVVKPRPGRKSKRDNVVPLHAVASEREREATAKTKAARAKAVEAKASRTAEFTDAWLVDQLVSEALYDKVCWVVNTKKGWWREYVGGVWLDCDETRPTELARMWFKAWLRAEIDADSSQARLTNVNKVGGRQRLGALVALAKGKVRRRIEDFDSDPDVINTPSCVVRLDRDATEPHSPRHLFTKRTTVNYKPGAQDADLATAATALPPESYEYLLDRLGQGITGHTPPDDKLIVQHGSGENGKTSINGLARNALGTYADVVPRELLLAKPGAHPTELMTLKGVRFAYIEELPEARTLNVQRLKETIGSPYISARGMREDFASFKASHMLIVNTNYRPVVRETDHGTWRRLEELPWPYRFRKAGEPLVYEMDRRGEEGLRERILASRASQEAIFAELVDRARKWYREGRTMPAPPPDVADATRRWRESEDVLFAYVSEGYVVEDHTRHIACADLEAHLNKWLESRRLSPWSDKLVTSRLTGHDALPFRFEKQKATVRHDGSTQFGVVSRPAIDRRFNLRGEYAEHLPKSYQAWVGVRFEEPEEEA